MQKYGIRRESREVDEKNFISEKHSKKEKIPAGAEVESLLALPYLTENLILSSFQAAYAVITYTERRIFRNFRYSEGRGGGDGKFMHLNARDDLVGTQSADNHSKNMFEWYVDHWNQINGFSL